MRLTTTLRFSMVAGAALFVAACGGHGGESANTATNDLDSNLMMDETGNDASAMESVANMPEPAMNDMTVNDAIPADTGPDTGGGDATGDQVDSNVAGM